MRKEELERKEESGGGEYRIDFHQWIQGTCHATLAVTHHHTHSLTLSHPLTLSPPPAPHSRPEREHTVSDSPTRSACIAPHQCPSSSDVPNT